MLGFGSVGELYKWVSCVELLNRIDDLPLLLLNSLDDPCVVEESYEHPRLHAGKKHMYVCTVWSFPCPNI